MDDQRAAADHVCATLRQAKHRALFAGGCVRDMLLDVEPKDYDIATSARPEEVAALFARTIDVGAKYGVQVVVLPQSQVEVTTFRKDGPYLDGRHPSSVEFKDEREDARRRDFTINAMFYDTETDEVVDYVSGREDLDAGIVRTVGDPKKRFEEDHLRLLRAVRFAARLGYTIESETLEAIKALAPKIHSTSVERIRDELIKLLTEGGAEQGLELLDETGLLAEILPEVAHMKGIEQPEAFHPEGDVFVHTLLMLGLMEDPSPTLALGVLLHDVGKPLTQTFEDRIRFNKHDKVGASVTEKICGRFHLSNADADRVTWLVGQHMRLGAAPQMRESKLKRFIREDGFDELLELGRLDCLASHRDLTNIDWVQDYIANLKPEEIKPPPLITGHDLIRLGYTPGPHFKKILTALEDAQLESKIETPQQAQTYLTKNWPIPTPPTE